MGAMRHVFLGALLMMIENSHAVNLDIGCAFNATAAENTGRTCGKRACIVSNDVCRKGQRECVCDGMCGYRCIGTKSLIYCKKLDEPGNGSVVYASGDQAFGSIATYKCDRGYLLSGWTEWVCNGDKEWTTDQNIAECRPQAEVCPRVFNSSQTALSNRGCDAACVIRRDCADKKQEDCLCDGDCGMSCLPVYVPGYCPAIEESDYSIVLSMAPRGRVYKSVASLVCREGYEIESGNDKRSCLMNRTWSGHPLICRQKASCPNPVIIENTHQGSRQVPYYPGDTITYSCRPGFYRYPMAESSTCQNNLTWTPVDMKCNPVSCGHPGYLRNGYREGSIFTFSNTVAFHCNDGYEMAGYPYRTCMSDQGWSSIMPICRAIECQQLYAPEHGTKQGNQLTYNAQIFFDCNSGYMLVGSRVRHCQGDKTWSGEEATCHLIRCPEPETPQHGYKIAPRRGVNAIVRFACKSGYTLYGNRTARCTAEGVWSQAVPECQVSCTVPSPPANGDYLYDIEEGDVVRHGTQLKIECNGNYRLNSAEPYTCRSGVWLFEPQCEAAPCTKLNEIENGEVSYQPYVRRSLETVPHGTTASFMCAFGFDLNQSLLGYSTLCRFGMWNEEPNLQCHPKLCEIENLPYGQVYYSKDNKYFSLNEAVPYHGVSRYFECASGYSLTPPSWRNSTCSDGQWSEAVPICQPDQCPKLADIEANFEYIDTTLDHGSHALLSCSEGHKPSVGNGTLQCHAGHWLPEGVHCIHQASPFNVAYGKPAQQSSEIVGVENLATDGDRNTQNMHHGCATVEKLGDDLFWKVDLQAVYKVWNVVIYHLAEESNLQHASIRVGFSHIPLESHSPCGDPLNSVTAEEEPILVMCSTAPISGQVISVQLHESFAESLPEKMTLCEVEVFATGPLPTCTIPLIPNSRIEYMNHHELTPNSNVPEGETIWYLCNARYTMDGRGDNFCITGGEWLYQHPSCEPDRCKVWDPSHGRLTRTTSWVDHGTVIQYECDWYYEKLYPRVTCKNGLLIPNPPTCVQLRCRLPMNDLRNILINNQEPTVDSLGNALIPHGTSIQFRCKEGFEMQDMDDTRPLCWEGTIMYMQQMPFCIRDHSSLQCHTPSVHNADIYYEGSNIATSDMDIAFAKGDIVSVVCIHGQLDNGMWSVVMECNGESWYPPSPHCALVTSSRRSCSRPDILQNVVQYVNSQVKLKNVQDIDLPDQTTIESRCKNPLTHILQTNSIRTCVNGNWQGEYPHCLRSQTTFALPFISSMIYQYFPNGTMLIYPGVGQLTIDCLVPAGYNPRLNNQSGQFWNSRRTSFGSPTEHLSGVYTCATLSQPDINHVLHVQVKAVTCPTLIPPGNGHLNGVDFHITKTVSFECMEGYDLIGKSKLQCNRGTWSGDVPSCRARNCSEIQLIDRNLNMTNTGITPGTTVAFFCQAGYTLVGDWVVVCQHGRWSKPIPHCEANRMRESSTPAPCHCELWERCLQNDVGKHSCMCIHPNQCKETNEEPVCGTNNQTYSSLCKMKATACLLETTIDVAKNGPCQEF